MSRDLLAHNCGKDPAKEAAAVESKEDSSKDRYCWS